MNSRSKRVLISIAFMAAAFLLTVLTPRPSHLEAISTNPTAFAGVWVERSPSDNQRPLWIKFEEHGPKLITYLRYSPDRDWDNAFGTGNIFGWTATLRVAECCGKIYQTPGYNYEGAAGYSTWNFRLTPGIENSTFGTLLVLTKETEWYVPCAGRQKGHERGAAIVMERVERVNQQPISKIDQVIANTLRDFTASAFLFQ
jgi:hypothetical protein